MTYQPGHVKRNPATGEVAIRTVYPDDEPALAPHAWLTASTHRGAGFVTSDQVADWDDLYTPPTEGS